MILFIDDEPSIRALMMPVLCDAGFEAAEAGSAAEALTIIQFHPSKIGVVFTDIHMPGTMDGVGLVHHVYQHWPTIKLLVASEKARPISMELPSGCHFLRKPYEIQSTIDRIQRMRLDLSNNWILRS